MIYKFNFLSDNVNRNRVKPFSTSMSQLTFISHILYYNNILINIL